MKLSCKMPRPFVIKSFKNELNRRVHSTTAANVFLRIKSRIESSPLFKRVDGHLSKWYIRYGIRVARTVGLVVAVYQAGYSAGLIDYASDPQKIDKGKSCEKNKILVNILFSHLPSFFLLPTTF